MEKKGTEGTTGDEHKTKARGGNGGAEGHKLEPVVAIAMGIYPASRNRDSLFLRRVINQQGSAVLLVPYALYLLSSSND